MPAAGQLRHSVVLERRRQGSGPGFALDTTYEGVGNAWARIEGVGGAMYQAGVQIEERITHRVTIRWRSRQDFNHILRNDQRYRVRRMRDPDGDRRWLVIEVEEITPGRDDA